MLLAERAKHPPTTLRLPLQLSPLDRGGGGGSSGGGGGGEREVSAAAAAAAAAAAGAAAAEARAADLAAELSLVKAQLAEGAELLVDTARPPLHVLMHVCTRLHTRSCVFESRGALTSTFRIRRAGGIGSGGGGGVYRGRDSTGRGECRAAGAYCLLRRSTLYATTEARP